MKNGDTSHSTSRNCLDTQRKRVYETSTRERQGNRLILDEKHCGIPGVGKGGGDTCTKINRKRKQNIRCQVWISLEQRRVRMKLIYMWRGPCNAEVQRHFLCRSITQREINIYTLHRAFIFSFTERGIPSFYHKIPAPDGKFLESCGDENGDKRNSQLCLHDIKGRATAQAVAGLSLPRSDFKPRSTYVVFIFDYVYLRCFSPSTAAVPWQYNSSNAPLSIVNPSPNII
jgi:hypothetical protein